MAHQAEGFAGLRTRAGLTVGEAAVFLGISVRQARRYERDECQLPTASQKLLAIKASSRSSRDIRSEASFRFIDLFAGIGGLRIGFEDIGGRCVFTSEWDRFSRLTYHANFPEDEDHVFGGDIREYSQAPHRIPAFDVLLAGFPCQPFSIAGVSKKNALGRPHGFLCDTQGTLFFDVARIIEAHRPVAFVLENVKNLERHDGGRTFATIMHVLREELGYQVQHRIIPANAWVPQKRERIFIVGFREPNTFDLGDLPIPPEPHPTLGTILEPDERVDPKYTLTPHLWNYLQEYKEKHRNKGNGFGYDVFGRDQVARTLSARYFKDGSEILIRQNDNRPRRLIPLECARLMGFECDDRSWKIPVSDTQAYKQFGNAVVVPVVREIAKLMKPFLAPAIAISS